MVLYYSVYYGHGVFVTLNVLLSNVMLVRLTLTNKGNLLTYLRHISAKFARRVVQTSFLCYCYQLYTVSSPGFLQGGTKLGEIN